MKRYKNYLKFLKSHFRSFLFLFLALFLFACEEPRCIEPEDITGITTFVPADGRNIIANDGTSQKTEWIPVGAVTNGDEFYITITGDWLPWKGEGLDSTFGSTSDEDRSRKNYCKLETLNIGSIEFDETGEFDYILNNHRKVKRNNVFEKRYLQPIHQKACWLNQGTGLYIGFFGSDGNSMPEVVHHLKSDVIKCKKEYQHNVNPDGSVAYADCWEDQDGKIVNKAITIYKARNFIKTMDGQEVRTQEKVKLIILDNSYLNNEGGYSVTFHKGIGEDEKGRFEELIEKIEKMFLGTVDQQTGERTGGVIGKIYHDILIDTMFSDLVRVSMIFYIMFLGIGMLRGNIKASQKELVVRIFKLSFVVWLLSPNGWNVFNEYVVEFFINGVGNLNATIADITDFIYNDYGEYVFRASSYRNYSSASRFAFIDRTARLLLMSPNIHTKIWGLLFSKQLYGLGFILVPTLYLTILIFILVLILTTYPYIISLIQVSLALSIAPIFIAFLLFDKTQSMFKKWLMFIAARLFEITFLFMMLYLMTSFVKKKILDVLTFKTCIEPLFENSKYDLFKKATVPMAYFEPGQLKVLLIGILVIWLGIIIFKYLISNLSSLTSSMFAIWGEGAVGGHIFGENLIKDIPKTAKKFTKWTGKKTGKLTLAGGKFIGARGIKYLGNNTVLGRFIKTRVDKISKYGFGQSEKGRLFNLSGKSGKLLHQYNLEGKQDGLTGMKLAAYARKKAGSKLNDDPVLRGQIDKPWASMYKQKFLKEGVRDLYDDAMKNPSKYDLSSENGFKKDLLNKTRDAYRNRLLEGLSQKEKTNLEALENNNQARIDQMSESEKKAAKEYLTIVQKLGQPSEKEIEKEIEKRFKLERKKDFWLREKRGSALEKLKEEEREKTRKFEDQAEIFAQLANKEVHSGDDIDALEELEGEFGIKLSENDMFESVVPIEDPQEPGEDVRGRERDIQEAKIAEVRYKNNKMRYRIAKLEYEKKRLAGDPNLRAAKDELDQAERNMENAKRNLESF